MFEVYTDKTKEQRKSYRFWRIKVIPHHDTCTHYHLSEDVWFKRIFPHVYFMVKQIKKAQG